MNIYTKWLFPSFENELIEGLARDLDVAPFFAKILLNRGIRSSEEAVEFLNPGLKYLHDPFIMKGMKEGVARIKKAIQNGETICIYGDYDADGVSSTAVLMLALKKLGAKVIYHIPHRLKEGYGLRKESIKSLKEKGVTLLVTVDCGITAIEEVGFAQSIGMDVIVTDHHRPLVALPPSCVIINPKQIGCPYPFKELAGVGVAFKLSQALMGLENEEIIGPEINLDLVALGTIADLMPLQGENRILVKYGLKAFNVTERVGVRALGEISGVDLRSIDAQHVGYRLAPRINAAGRMGDAARGLNLFLSNDQAEAAALAVILDDENKKRQKVEREILKDAKSKIGASTEKDIIVLSSQEWHRGAIGIVASRMVEAYNRPAVMIALENGIGYASARSTEGVDIFNMLNESSDLLLTYGGHYYAAGFTINENKIEELSSRLEDFVSKAFLLQDEFVPKIIIDSQISPDEIASNSFKEYMGLLSPFGKDNPSPVFASSDLLVVRPPRIVGNNHLALAVEGGGKTVNAIGFGMGDFANKIEEGSRVDIAFTPIFKSSNYVEIKIQDIRAKQ